jgi:hypothetical protein
MILSAGSASPTGHRQAQIPQPPIDDVFCGRAGHACRGNHLPAINYQVTEEAFSKYKTRFWFFNKHDTTR